MKSYKVLLQVKKKAKKIKLGNQKNFQNWNDLGFRQYNQRRENRKQFDYINYFYCNQRGHHIGLFHFRNGTYVLKENEKLA